MLRHVKKAVPPYHLANSITLQQGAEDRRGAQHCKRVDIGFADIAFLQYTGGTTGVSKGAMLSHRNMVYNVQQTITWQDDAYEGVDPIVAITALPLYHIFSLQGNCLTVMAQGGQNVLITNPRDFEGFAKEIAKHKFNLFTGVNTMFASLMNTPSFKQIDFSAPARLRSAAAWPCSQPLPRTGRKKTGNTILQGYGLTETSPAAIVCRIDHASSHGTIGLPIPSTDVMIAVTTAIRCPGRSRRDLHQGTPGHGGLLAAPDGNGRGHVAGRLAAYRRHRAHGRRWLSSRSKTARRT